MRESKPGISLREAAARFLSPHDPDKGYEILVKDTNRQHNIHLRLFGIFDILNIVSVVGLILCAIFAFAMIIVPVKPFALYFLTLMLISIAMLALHFAPHYWENGYKRRESPFPLDIEIDDNLRLFCDLMSRETTKIYYCHPCTGKVELKSSKRAFFGKSRLLLFSEYEDIVRRAWFPHHGFVRPELRMSEEQLAKLIADAKPKRRGGPGAPRKYDYEVAIASILIERPELGMMDIEDEPKALAIVQGALAKWFDDHADESGDVPQTGLLKPHADKIVRAIKINRGIET